MSNTHKTAVVTVSREGVQFGPNSWFSHEKITGVPLAILQDPNSTMRSLAAANYHNWVAEALNTPDIKAEMISVEVKVDEAMLQAVRDTLSSKERVFFDIVAERIRQNEQWGGPGHDDEHAAADWLRFVVTQAVKAREGCLDDNYLIAVDPEGYRARLVKIAALAVAAIESHDRKYHSDEGEAGPAHYADFGKNELLDYLAAVLPEEVSIRKFALSYWAGINAGLDQRDRPVDAAMQRALAATREFNGAFLGASNATVSMDFTDASITVEVEG